MAAKNLKFSTADKESARDKSHHAGAQQGSWSETIWGIPWAQLFPTLITESIRVEYLRHQEAIPVMQKLFPEVFTGNAGTNNDRFYDPGDKGLKAKYYDQAGDFFVFYDEANKDRIAGMVACTFQDWTSYNMRNVSVHPDYQQNGIYHEFYSLLCGILARFGVSRIEGDIAPSNLHHLAVLAKMGYIPTAMSVSDRWGALVHVTKYLVPEEEDRFADLYSATSETNKAANARFRKKAQGARPKPKG